MRADTDLRGVVAACLTPVTADFAIDADRLAAHVARLRSEGCRFVSTFGTTGEGASLSVAAKLEALEGLADRGIDPGDLIPGVMSASLGDATAMLEGIARIGCRGALVLPPFYHPVGDDGVVAFFDALLARVPGIDVLLYNIPKLSRIAFSPELVARLVERHGGRIVGLKDSTGDRDAAVTFARRFPDLSIFVGDDRVLPDLLAAGGAGLIGGMPNLFAADTAAFLADPTGPDAPALTAAAHARIDAVVAAGDLVALKAALARRLGDPEWRRAVPPLQAISDVATDALERALAAAGRTAATA